MVSVIVATAKNNVIGNKGDIPWRGTLPADMKYFAEKTTGQAVIMGRTTYLSIPAKYRPLPNRLNLVLSSASIPDEGVITFQSLQAAIDYGINQDKEVFIAGGGSVYKEALNGQYQIDRVLRTLIDLETEGDTFFPTLDHTWQMAKEECHAKDDRNKYDYCFQTYERVRL
ncbi:MAG: dihydrofolate reductase [Candidatus Berkelbacteria bacterium]|nr:dihydrofolate reductase [Candidatus Berkelbacteria bacterium]MCR4308229.1 dihydrofolate reductase [Candidatus Berkelbacteria bacterium]